MKYIISVTCKDKPGIISDISKAIFSNGGNISDMSQNVLLGYFIGSTCADFDKEIDINQLKEDLLQYNPCILPFEENSYEKLSYEQYILTITSKEQKGIVAKVTNYLFEKNINIESFSAFTKEDKFYIVSQISVPNDKSLLKIKHDIKSLGNNFNFSLHLSHENIYLATNTICPTVRIGK